MHRVPQRFLNSGDFWANFIQIGSPQFFCWQFDLFGKTAIGRDSYDEVVRADMGIANFALVATTAEDVGFCGNDVARLVAVMVLGIRAGLDNFSQKFVPANSVVLVFLV